ncbi:CAF17-like 4Fe-4S cluster assembly/insertion protein YgfZ [Natronobacterium gregoryi]|uniref:Aminomethyl transferase family protein n=2 Tax=Natronobacterium gregoryi TaxID=44930 RepID=L0AKD4_NATGS|nr:glycine cleavage T C-terminal barrel domain-containing protein [Natronobacterium gregoryi]AFZ73612.1 folate-binding protein YgfZ [Natronobacterium gregoryi SP2]ELY67895.1 folate-binding protein YgfZ [Natronobacterium gregoryi SP2]PLK19999.1 aminomethyl transferase family protein [Natronobacterium gregoryi SP2]SFJ34242.1 aminomethyltransferase [Natronobacterium gregoryi]
MSVIESIHEDHGATFGERGGRTIVEHFGRPERTHRAVRNGVGLLEIVYGVVVVEGDDRLEYVDNVVSNRVPSEDGRGCYALVLEPQGAVEVELYVYNAGERLLLFVPPEKAEPLAEEWSEKVFIQDVDIRVATDEYGIFGIHGPQATEKIASVLNGAASPDQRLSFVRGSMGDSGVTVARTDALTGEESYEVICAAADADAVYDVLLNQGLNAAPFGYRVFESLTLEAGSPRFESELAGTVPNVLGLRNALDFEKGCYVGQEVVSRVENQGRPSRRLTGLTLSSGVDDGEPRVPDPGAAVFDGDASVGEVTRAGKSPLLEETIALALVDYDLESGDLTVRVGGEEVPASRTELPFYEGSDRSARLPDYE